MQFLAERRVAKTRNYDWFWNFQNTHHFAIDAPLSILCINVFRILNRKDFRISRAQAQRWERSPPGPGFDSQTWRHMWVKFVASSRLAPRVFLRVLRRGFLPLRINQHSKFQFDMETVDKKSHLVECSFSKCPFIYFILFL